MADLPAQLQLNQQINKAINDRNALITQQTTLLTQQLNIAKQLRDALGGEAARETAGATRDMTAAIQGANDAAQEGADRQGELSAALGATSKQSGIASKAFKTFAKAAGAGFAAVGSLAGGLFDVIGTIGKLSLSIISIPFKIFGKLFETARDFGDAMNSTALRQAMEDVRKEFGDLASGPGEAVVSAFREIRKEASNLAGTGLRVSQVFGFGAEGLAAMLKEVQGLASATGEKFHVMQDIFSKSGGSLAIMSKGLGLSHENMSALMTLAEARGENVEKTMTEFSKTAIQTAKRFGLGVKDLANGMAELIKDVSTFGHLGPKAFAPMVVYARKLGLEVKSLAGVMKKFSGFSETAQAASEMSAAFGLNVDAMKLMAEQDPTKKVDMLRKAFFATGKTIKDMSYQERQYLQQLSGFEGEEFERVFGDAKRGVEQKKIQTETEKATAATMKQAKVMKELGKQIERMVHAMERPKVTGFFDALMKGFELGVTKSKEWKALMWNIDKSAQALIMSGKRIGLVFIESFGGLDEIFKPLIDFFQPERFAKFGAALESAFGILTKDKEKLNWKGFFDKIEEGWNELIKPAGPLFKMMKEGFEKLIPQLASGLGSLLVTATEKLVVPFVKGLTGFFQKVGEKMKGGAGVYDAIFGSLTEGFDTSGTSEMFAPLLQSFSEIAKKIGPLLEPLWNEAKPVLEPILKDLGELAVGAFLSGASASLLGSAASWFSGISMLFNVSRFFGAGAGGGGGGGFFGSMKTFFTNGFTKLFGIVTKVLKGLLKKLPLIGAILSIGDALIDAFQFEGTFAEKVTEFGASFLSSLTFGLVDKDTIKNAGEKIGEWLWDKVTFTSDEEIAKREAERKASADHFAQQAIENDKKTKKQILDGIKTNNQKLNDLLEGGMSNKDAILQNMAETAALQEMAKLKDNKGHFLTGDKYTAKLKELTDKYRGEFAPKVEEAIKTAQEKKAADAAQAIKDEAERKEQEFLDGIAKAQKVASQVQDLVKLESDLKKAKDKIKTLNPESLGASLKAIMPKYVEAFKAIAEAFNTPEIKKAITDASPAISEMEKTYEKIMSPIETMSKTVNLLATSIKGIKDQTAQMNADLIAAPFSKVLKALDQKNGLVDVVNKIHEMSLEILTANYILAPESLANVKPIVDAIADFKGGTLKVQHSLPNTKIELTVNIDSKKLGTELLQVDLGDSNASPKVRTSTYFGTGQQPTKIVGA
jgi:hypothetical protein